MYIEAADLSVQRQDANRAWKTIAHIATELGFKTEVTFAWADNAKVHAGEVGKLTLNN